MDSAEECFRLRQQIREELGGSEDDSDAEPLENGWGTYGDYQLVGNGRVTKDTCGKFLSFKGCLRVDLHNMITLDGKSYKGKVFVKKVRHYCNKPSCPICFKHGWAVREAGRIEARLKEMSKRFGQVEHIVVSVPMANYGLSLEALRDKVYKMLGRLGVGGNMIFHAFRYNLRKHWYWSPHFHVLGFILGGYSRCRHCRGADCYACDGFEGKCYKTYRENGYIVRVLGERKTIFGTAWYQLNHASLKVGAKRFHVNTWFGFCSYRKMKVTVEKREELCPICRHELTDMWYRGVKRFVLNRNSLSYERESFEDYAEDGIEVWTERVKKRYGSGSYGE